jgi:Sulfotransferase family
VTARSAGSPAESSPHASVRARARSLAVNGLWHLRSLAVRDQAGPRTNTTLLLGSARSGTTWVADVIDRHHDHRVIFEPLRPGTSTALRGWWPTRYLAAGDTSPVLRDSMAALLDGRLKGAWMDHTNASLRPRRRLVKEIEANCLVPWLGRHFPEVRTVVLVRHPATVVSSRMRLGWKDNLHLLTRDEQLRQDYPFVADVEALAGDDPYLRMVAKWAVETAVPLSTEGDHLCFVGYEELQSHPEPTVARLLAHLDQRPDAALRAAMETRSRTTDLVSKRVLPDGSGAATTERARAAQHVLDRVGLDLLYDMSSPDTPVPDWDAVRRAVRARVL